MIRGRTSVFSDNRYDAAKLFPWLSDAQGNDNDNCDECYYAQDRHDCDDDQDDDDYEENDGDDDGQKSNYNDEDYDNQDDGH
jgi:hypothetical protein